MIIVEFTNGFGNNIFQYVAARLLAEHHGKELLFVTPDDYYAIPDLKKMGATKFITYGQLTEIQKSSSLIFVNDQNYTECFNVDFQDSVGLVRGYFEDYTYYLEKMDTIKSWFTPVSQREDNDLVVHFRTGDTLIQKNNFGHKPSADKWVRTIERFDFDKLHIVSDFPKWGHVSKEEIEAMSGLHNPSPGECIADKQKSADYINSCVDAFSKFSPMFKHGKIYEDFNYVRSFGNILFQHGTFGWWAAALSNARKIGVYGPWRPWKGKSNKNLSNIPLEEWFKWE